MTIEKPSAQSTAEFASIQDTARANGVTDNNDKILTKDEYIAYQAAQNPPRGKGEAETAWATEFETDGVPKDQVDLQQYSDSNLLGVQEKSSTSLDEIDAPPEKRARMNEELSRILVEYMSKSTNENKPKP